MPSRVGAWMYHTTITNTPTIPTIAKTANWIRIRRVSIYEPPSVGAVVTGTTPGTGAPRSGDGAPAGLGPGAAGAADAGGPGSSGPGSPIGPGSVCCSTGAPTGGGPGRFGAPNRNCRYSGSPGDGAGSAPRRSQWVPRRMLLRSPEFVKSMMKYPLT